MALVRTEPQIVGRKVSASLRHFLGATDALHARPWWEELSGIGSEEQVAPPDIDQVIKRALARSVATCDAMLQMAVEVGEVSQPVSSALGMVERVLRGWTLTRMREGDAVAEGMAVTSMTLPVVDSATEGAAAEEGVGVLEEPAMVKLMRDAARDSLPAPVSTWALNAIDVARGEGAHRHLIEAVFWLVEGSIRVQQNDEHARLAALRVHTSVVLSEYAYYLAMLQDEIDKHLPLETRSRDEVIEEFVSAVPEQERAAARAAWKRHKCSARCGHDRMDPRVALRTHEPYRAAMRAAYGEAAEATIRLRESLDAYAGQLGLHAIFPAHEAGAMKAMLDTVAEGLRRAVRRGFSPPRRQQRADRRDMRERGHDPNDMMRRVALTVAGALAGMSLVFLSYDVMTLVRNAPITDRAYAAHWNMEHPPLTVGVRDLEALGVPRLDIDGILRVLRGFVDRAEVENERGLLLAALEKFRAEKGVHQTERTDHQGHSTLRWRVTKMPDPNWWAISQRALVEARARVERGVAGVDFDLDAASRAHPQ